MPHLRAGGIGVVGHEFFFRIILNGIGENDQSVMGVDYTREFLLHYYLRIGCETCTLEVFSAIQFEGSFMSTVHVPLFLPPTFLLWTPWAISDCDVFSTVDRDQPFMQP